MNLATWVAQKTCLNDRLSNVDFICRKQAHDRMAELERESLAKLAELETELGALKVEYADAIEARRLAEEELTALKRQKQDSARRQSVLENKIIELETLTGTLTKGSSGNETKISLLSIS